MTSSFIHVVTYCRIFFLFFFLRLNSILLCVFTQFIYLSFVGGCLGCFHILTLVSYIAVKMKVLISLWDSALNSSGCVPRNGISGLYGNAIFNFLRDFRTSFHSSRTCTTYVPTNSAQGCGVSTSSPTFVIFCAFKKFNYRSLIFSVLKSAHMVGHKLCTSTVTGIGGSKYCEDDQNVKVKVL